jgi:hypothetical protein
VTAADALKTAVDAVLRKKLEAGDYAKALAAAASRP